jgi:hypothetical protein
LMACVTNFEWPAWPNLCHLLTLYVDLFRAAASNQVVGFDKSN